MAKSHGKETVIKVGSDDISQYTNASELERGADDHDTTCYGADDHVYDGGLGNHTFKMSGMYDTTATTGPRDVLKDTPGTKVTITRQPEGTGSGKPQDSFSFLVTKYVESNPVADYVTWSCEGKVSGAITDTAQS
jgi:hypothetical protein